MSETSSTASSLTRLGSTVGAGFLFVLGPAPVMPDTSAFDWILGEDSRQTSVLLAVGNEGSKSRITPIKVSFDQPEHKPRTRLGERLMAIRAQAVSKGMDLLSWDEVSEEVRKRRGERLSGE